MSSLPITDDVRDGVSRKMLSVVESPRSFFVFAQDRTLPTRVRTEQARVETKFHNSGVMQVRHSLGQRTNLRVNFEVATRSKGTTVYRRLRQRAAFISCPNPDQAELVVDAIMAFALSLDGKWLTPSNNESTPLTTNSPE